MKLIAYYRVSTQQQGRSGLGLEGQQAAIKEFAKRSKAEIMAAFTEVESGRCRRRPHLAAALALAKVETATIVVAKLDRLAKDTAFLLSILDAGTSVEFLDFPQTRGVTGRLVITIMAAVAEFESRRIGERMAAAYQTLKTRGGRKWKAFVGRLRRIMTAARRKRRKEAMRFRASIRPVIRAYRGQGRTWAWIAGKLNEDRITTWDGSTWRMANVERVMRKYPWECCNST